MPASAASPSRSGAGRRGGGRFRCRAGGGGADGVVPLAVHVVAADDALFEVPHPLCADLHAVGVAGVVEDGGDTSGPGRWWSRRSRRRRPLAVIRGRARQVRVMWQNSRCSILFHLLVPGGKWQTRDLQPGLPRQQRPARASRAGQRYGVGAAGVAGDQQPPRARVTRPRPRARHRRRSALTANAAVSWLVPTDDEAAVRGDVVDPVGGDLPQLPGRGSRGRGPAPGRPAGRHDRPAR